MLKRSVTLIMNRPETGRRRNGCCVQGERYRLERMAALKITTLEKTSDPDRSDLLVQEAGAASALNHPNIITIYDTDDGVDFIAMEYVAGGTLASTAGHPGYAPSRCLAGRRADRGRSRGRTRCWDYPQDLDRPISWWPIPDSSRFWISNCKAGSRARKAHLLKRWLRLKRKKER